MQFVMFSKMLISLPVDEVGAVVKDLGFDGVDLTVRPPSMQGHVLPENVKRDLPRALAALAKHGLAVPMITTAITDAADPTAEPIFRTAARLGIRSLKLGYWRYQGFGRIREQIAAIRAQLEGIEALAREHGVRACLHNHSGDNMSALAPVVASLLDGFDPTALGAYVDPGHMTAEGSIGGWKQGLDLLQDRISLVAAKSFGWFPVVDPATGESRWDAKLVPLREGSVRWREVFAILHRIGYDGVVSLHSEYQGAHSWRDLALPDPIEQTRADLAYIRSAASASPGLP